MRKKLTILCMGLCMALLLAGCGKKGAEEAITLDEPEIMLKEDVEREQAQAAAKDEKGEAADAESDPASASAPVPGSSEEALAQGDLLAAGYDYDNAIAMIKSFPGYESEASLTSALAGYEAAKASCVAVDVTTIPHVFYHSLVVDNSKAFDGDSKEAGYNQVMTTVDEFNKITQQMYDSGFVLVRLRDMVTQTTDEDGTVHFTQGQIMLPPGKKAYVMSIDDVSYYHYMDGDGFPSKLVVDENGLPKNEYIKDDGTKEIGDFDVMPLMDTFIKEHPDAAYRGAKGIIALTGYNGVLGYRTDTAYKTKENLDKIQKEFLDANPNFNYEQECEEAKKVAQALKEDGWEFASHTWGHKNYGTVTDEVFYADADKWQERVAPIVGKTDMVIFPFGADIGDWRPYSGERFEYLKSQGFNFFCNVDSSKSWVQVEDNYMRQGRRNLDGYRMYYDLIGETDKLSDLFDVKSVFSADRPTPVPPMG